MFNNPTCYDDSIPPVVELCGGVVLHESGGGIRVITESVANLGVWGDWGDAHLKYIEVLGNY